MKGAIGALIVIALALVAFLLYSPADIEDHNEESKISTSSSINKDSKDLPAKTPKIKSNSNVTEASKDQDEEDSWAGYDKEKAREVLRDESIPVGASSYTGPRPLTEKEMDKMDEVFESYEKGWDNEMKSLLLNQMGMTQEDYGDYLKMRSGYEEDRLEAFESFHKRMAQEKGPHYSYSPTQEMMEFENKLKKEYLDLFRKRYGEEAYARYQDALDRYNSKIRKEADPKIGVLNIEF